MPTTPKAREKATAAAGSEPLATPHGPIPAVADTGPVGGPSGIRVRMYRVGFGDFFLLSLKKGAKAAHILVDCGVHAKPTGSIDEAIAQLKLDTGGKIALIVMTHRHADHISGFASGADTFKTFDVSKVWMPWFENPADPKAARFQANLTAVATKLQLCFAARANLEDAEYIRMAENATGSLGVSGISANQVALDTLHSGFAGKKAAIQYLKAGDAPDLPPELVAIGFGAQILGPPSDPALISQMDGKSHQYLTALDANLEAAAAGAPAPIFDSNFDSNADAFGNDALGSGGAARIEAAIANAQPDVVRAIAAATDNTLNNQSVVILFTFNDKKLLFAGDAQWGNWQNFLFGGALGSPGHTKLTPEAIAILKSIDFYKVGHHGSTNATPIDALEAMREGVVAMCSTAICAYGTVANDSEVPRIPLMAALEKKTGGKLARSDQVEVPGAVTQPGPLDPVFTTPTGSLFIDYQF